MSAMDKVNNILGKLPFVKLAGNIPEGIRGKIPVLNTLIPFANRIASGVAVVVVVVAVLLGCGSGNPLANTTWQSNTLDGNIYAFDETTFSSQDGILGFTYTGTYTISGKKVILTYDHDGSKWEWSIAGGSLKNDLGSIFTRIR